MTFYLTYRTEVVLPFVVLSSYIFKIEGGSGSKYLLMGTLANNRAPSLVVVTEFSSFNFQEIKSTTDSENYITDF